MNTYLIGIFSAFSGPVLHAWANILDNYLSNKLFAKLTPLIFFSSLTGLIVIPIVWLLDPPTLISFQLGMVLFAVSLIEVLYLYPYFWSLRHADTSVVASLFSLGKIVVPILAFLFVGERLTAPQYGGFFILTLASVLATLDLKKLKFNRAFALMLVVSVILSVQTILLKYVYEQGVGWGSSVIWMAVFSLFIISIMMLASGGFNEIKRSAANLRVFMKPIICMELLTWGGTLGSSYALYLIPASITTGIDATQPIFVLIYALLFGKVWSNLFKEQVGIKSVAKKVSLFAIMIVGVVLITGI